MTTEHTPMPEAARYLLVLYVAERRREGPISPGRVADALDRSPSATTEMLQRLETRGMVTHEPYEGATLTAEGRDAATDLYETYRVLSRFCRDVLDIDDHEGEALRLAGSVSPQVAARLASALPDGEDGADDGAAPHLDSL